MQTPEDTGLHDHPRSAPRPPRRRARPYAKHGLHKLKEAVRTLGSRTIDRRTVLGRALTQWRAEIIDALGGPDAVSPQQLVVVDQATTTKLLLDSVNAWLITQPSLVNTRKRSLIPVVQQRQQLADALVRYMTLLGLERQRPEKTLQDYVTEALAEPEAADASQRTAHTSNHASIEARDKEMSHDTEDA